MLKDKDKIFKNLYGFEHWNLEGAKKRGDGTFKPEDKPLNKKEVEALLASQSGGYQTIRIETPIKILGAEVVDRDRTPPKK